MPLYVGLTLFRIVRANVRLNFAILKSYLVPEVAHFFANPEFLPDATQHLTHVTQGAQKLKKIKISFQD